MEANNASSRKDFRNKIYICKKETQETKHWLRMLKTSEPGYDYKIELLLNEVQQLLKIFQKITQTLELNDRKQ